MPCRMRLHRVDRHAHLEDGREHAGGLRRLHQHLRHPACRRRQGNVADLLREPHLNPSRPRSIGLRPTRCVVHLSRPT